MQEAVGVHSSGYVLLDDMMVCGDAWDMEASLVICRELGWGPPVEIAGFVKDPLGS